MNEELLNLKKSVLAAEKAYRQSKGYSEDSCESEKSDELYQMISSIYRYIDAVDRSLWDYIGNHNEGHLPKILGTEKMTNALKALGLDGDYNVAKPTVWASKVSTLEVDYK